MKLPTSKNRAEKMIPPITRYRSRASVASSRSGPRPGHPVATSTSNEPLSSEAIEKPKSEIAGLAAQHSGDTAKARGYFTKLSQLAAKGDPRPELTQARTFLAAN